MSALQTLKSTFKGDVLTPGDDGYDQALSRWARNAARPAAVVAFVKDAEDVSAAILYAKQNGLPIAIKGGGHNPSGASSSEGGLVIDLSRHLNIARIDPEKKLGYVGGGAIWETVDKAAIQHGLATVGGTVNHHGLAIDNLVTIVTADGTVRTANETENPDLFWAIRGGGSNFGVVTEFVLRLHPQRHTVFAGPVVFPGDALDKVHDVTLAWRKAGPSQKEGMIQVLTRGPNGQPCVVLFPFYNGTEEEARKVYKAFFDLNPVADLAKEIPYEKVNSLQNEIAAPGQNVYLRGAVAPEPIPHALLQTALGRVAALSAPDGYTIGLLLEYFPLGVANAVPDDATALPRALAPNVLAAVYAREDGADVLAYIRDAARELTGVFAEASGGAMGYGNYSPDSEALPTEGAVPANKAKELFGANYPRLQEIKKKYDPELVFRKWFNITPA
ncbi:FAD-binding domain-containing protein [Lenzites betulinus]|nr:FAD-binding domain-containing protein [Lenzites betulinus]